MLSGANAGDKLCIVLCGSLDTILWRLLLGLYAVFFITFMANITAKRNEKKLIVLTVTRSWPTRSEVEFLRKQTKKLAGHDAGFMAAGIIWKVYCAAYNYLSAMEEFF